MRDVAAVIDARPGEAVSLLELAGLACQRHQPLQRDVPESFRNVAAGLAEGGVTPSRFSARSPAVMTRFAHHHGHHHHPTRAGSEAVRVA
jgi:hypothetical protein